MDAEWAWNGLRHADLTRRAVRFLQDPATTPGLAWTLCEGAAQPHRPFPEVYAWLCDAFSVCAAHEPETETEAGPGCSAAQCFEGTPFRLAAEFTDRIANPLFTDAIRKAWQRLLLRHWGGGEAEAEEVLSFADAQRMLRLGSEARLDGSLFGAKLV